jgi:hypothetical protein
VGISSEVHEYVKDQVVKLLEDYLKDYFDKEINWVRLKLVDAIKKATGDDAYTHKMAGLAALSHPPRLRHEKFKSVEALVSTVGNLKFVTTSLSIVGDSLRRMLIIGQGDGRLASRVQQLYFFLLEFVCEGLFLPATQACTALLLQKAGARASNSTLPSMDFLSILGTIFSSLDRMKSFFNTEFVKILSTVPNALPICRESRKRSVKAIENGARDSLHAFSISIIAHIEKQLTSLQSKYDYYPKALDMGLNRSQISLGVTLACSNACKSLSQVFAAVKACAGSLDRLNFVELFIKPLGQQFIGVLITHIKKMVISREGAANLLRDMDEYCNVSSAYVVTVAMPCVKCDTR